MECPEPRELKRVEELAGVADSVRPQPERQQRGRWRYCHRRLKR